MKLFPRSLLFFCLFNCFFAVKNLACPSLAKKLLFFTTLLLADQAKTQANPSVHDCYPTNHSLTENLQFFDDCASTGRCENVRPDVAACLKHPIFCPPKVLSLLKQVEGNSDLLFQDLVFENDKLVELLNYFSQLGIERYPKFSISVFRSLCPEQTLAEKSFSERLGMTDVPATASVTYGSRSNKFIIDINEKLETSNILREFVIFHEISHVLFNDISPDFFFERAPAYSIKRHREESLDRVKSDFSELKMYAGTTQKLVNAKLASLKNTTNFPHPISFFKQSQSRFILSNIDHAEEFLADGLAFVALYLKYGNINFEPLFKDLARIFNPSECDTHPSKDDRIAFLRQVLLSLQKEDLSSN